MSAVFRTSLFGGFRKKDVLNYLDALAAEKAKESAFCGASPNTEESAEAQRLAALEIELREMLEARDAAQRVAEERAQALEQAKAEYEQALHSQSECAEALRLQNAALEESLVKKNHETEPVSSSGEASTCEHDRAEEVLHEFSTQLDRVVDELIKVVKSLPPESGTETAEQIVRNSSVREILARVQQMKRKI